MIQQYAGPTDVAVTVTATCPWSNTNKHINAFRSLLRQQKIKAVCYSYSNFKEIWTMEFRLDRTHSLQPYCQHSYYKKLYTFNIKETTQMRQVFTMSWHI